MEEIKSNIQDYQFQNLDKKSSFEDGKVKKYSLDLLNPSNPKKNLEKSRILKLERKKAEENNFIISPIVKEHRGINAQEAVEKERRIQDEVEKRLIRLEEDAWKKGYEEGVVQGRDEIFRQTRAESEEKLSELTNMISEVLSTNVEMMKQEKAKIYSMIKNLTKWIILRELKDDGEYVERLLEKLIVEMQAKSNVLVQVNQESFEKMPDILEHVQNTLGKMENVRVEVDYDIDGPGLILDSDNGIINGTLLEQFKSLDRLFHSVGVEGIEEINVKEYMNANEEESAVAEDAAETNQDTKEDNGEDDGGNETE